MKILRLGVLPVLAVLAALVVLVPSTAHAATRFSPVVDDPDRAQRLSGTMQDKQLANANIERVRYVVDTSTNVMTVRIQLAGYRGPDPNDRHFVDVFFDDAKVGFTNGAYDGGYCPSARLKQFPREQRLEVRVRMNCLPRGQVDLQVTRSIIEFGGGTNNVSRDATRVLRWRARG